METLLDSVMNDLQQIIQQGGVSPRLARAVKCFTVAVRLRKRDAAEFFADKVHIYHQVGGWDDEHQLERWAIEEQQLGAIKVLAITSPTSAEYIINDARKAQDSYLLNYLINDCGLTYSSS